MKKWLFMNSVATHCKNVAKAMVLVNSPWQENPIAVIFVVVVWPGEAYEIGFYKNSSNIDVLNMSFWGRNGSPSLRFHFWNVEMNRRHSTKLSRLLPVSKTHFKIRFFYEYPKHRFFPYIPSSSLLIYRRRGSYYGLLSCLGVTARVIPKFEDR